MTDSLNHLFLGIFFVAALVVPALPIVLARFIAPKRPGPVKNEVYECGVEAKGDSWIQFRIQYVTFAILFVIFDVEALFLFPWAVVFKGAGWAGLAAMGLFIGILTVGLIYAWQEGLLEWES
ncbi:MAG: NADH-quinone oxidoreductase subunit A [Candidatus Omnitrophica bacterium CG11_big_fil_rev_8_21_14_0_20_64_10]|nr:MAG: NADH-quinone oxidoreductase subunit A [Candidatus Omnitrophica bacterium CG11_big_fil_rev_8_21_14_0_20_64_10]